VAVDAAAVDEYNTLLSEPYIIVRKCNVVKCKHTGLPIVFTDICLFFNVTVK